MTRDVAWVAPALTEMAGAAVTQEKDQRVNVRSWIVEVADGRPGWWQRATSDGNTLQRKMTCDPGHAVRHPLDSQSTVAEDGPDSWSDALSPMGGH